MTKVIAFTGSTGEKMVTKRGKRHFLPRLIVWRTKDWASISSKPLPGPDDFELLDWAGMRALEKQLKVIAFDKPVKRKKNCEKGA